MARTLDDLAELSGVSRATVSRVINGGPVSAATRRRVLEVIEGTNYRPNLAARSLASGRTGVVGVVMHVDPPLLFEDSYFVALLHGVSDVLADRASGMMLWLGNRSKEETLNRILGTGLMDGVIVTADNLDDALVDGLLASDLPTVLIGHRRSDLTASYVDVDNVGASDTITTHLIEIGRTRIGHITGRRGTVAGEDRLSGYLRAMRRAGLKTDDLIVEGDFNRPSGLSGGEILLDREVDAIFCANDAMASGALQSVRARGLSVPEDVALAGFDDLPFAAELDPPLSTIRQGVHAQGSESAKALLSLLQNPEGGPRRVLLPTELVIRQSTVGVLSG
ncbi:MAG: LacI family DNA-binding transcriptional regulator [Acidimicrobiia bacterium]